MNPWSYWEETLGRPKFILAPMVDHSELPWRMLSREYGCHVTYTPMFHALNFSSQKKYRQKYLTTCPDDRPLIVQFCANDAEVLLSASKHVEDVCDGIDINLGCPQEIAKRGRYGAFLQDDWDLIRAMVSKLRNNLRDDIGVSCKIRRFDRTDRTVQYAQMIENAGCTFIGVHARTREQRGCKTGLADWDHIKRVKEAISIPVIANGNIQSLRDAEECLSQTGADAVMSAEGNLYNPGIFFNVHPPTWIVAQRYIDMVRKYPIPAGMAKAHIFKIFHRCVAMEENADLRVRLGQSTTLDQISEVVSCFEQRYASSSDQTLSITVQPVPPYLCQPRFRYDAGLKTSADHLESSDSIADKKKIKLDL